MLTGYYGKATSAGVIDFQIDMHLPQTGVLDAQTRAALTQMTCGYGYNQPQPYNYNQYPWNVTQPWYNYGSYSYGNNYTGNCSSVYGASTCQCGWYTVGGESHFNNCGYNNPPNTIYPNNNNYPYNNGNANAPTISNVSGPTSLNVNTTGTWIVSINNPYSSNYSSVSVNWGEVNGLAYMAAPQQIYGSQSATFTHAYSQPGTYTVTFTVSNGYGSNTSTATVQVGGSNYGTPYITSITPSYGPVGTQITIYGSGFTGDNTVHFGNGGRMHVSSSGNYLYFTIPTYLSPCDVQTSGTYCAQYIQNVTPGQYQMYVTANGNNSNSLTFTVQ
jgi:hypothetical protein